VAITGTMVNGVVNFSMQTQNGAIMMTASGYLQDARHIAFQYVNANGSTGTGQFHVNHPPDQ
jgi:hypothetical protein